MGILVTCIIMSKRKKEEFSWGLLVLLLANRYRRDFHVVLDYYNYEQTLKGRIFMGVLVTCIMNKCK